MRQRPLTGLALLERCHGEMDTTFRHTNIRTHYSETQKKEAKADWSGSGQEHPIKNTHQRLQRGQLLGTEAQGTAVSFHFRARKADIGFYLKRSFVE